MKDSLPFKIGDRVEVSKSRPERDLSIRETGRTIPILNRTIGKIGTIVNMTAHTSPMWVVQFEGETYPDGVGICMNQCELRKINLNTNLNE